MERTTSSELLCEVCAKPLAKKGDFLCAGCSEAFTLLLQLLNSNPKLDLTDLDRIKDIFEWRMKKTGRRPLNPEARDEKVLWATPLS